MAKKPTAQLTLIVLVISFAVECGSIFLSANNLISIIKQIFVIRIAAFRISFLIIIGNLDFSTGQVYTFVGTVTIFPFFADVPIILTMLVGLTDGILILCLTYFISIDFEVGRLIVSMAVGTTVNSLNYIIARNKTTYGFPDGIKRSGQGYLFNLIPTSTMIFLGLAVIVSSLFRRTYLGRYLFVMGGSDDVTRLSRVHVNKIKLMTSVTSDLPMGIVGLVSMSRTFSGSSLSGDSLSQDVISATVLDGVSVSDGADKTSRVITGTTTMRTLSVGLNMMGFNTNSQDIFEGSILLAVVILSAPSKGRKTGIKK